MTAVSTPACSSRMAAVWRSVCGVNGLFAEGRAGVRGRGHVRREALCDGVAAERSARPRGKDRRVWYAGALSEPRPRTSSMTARKNTVCTRNARLSAVHALFRPMTNIVQPWPTGGSVRLKSHTPHQGEKRMLDVALQQPGAGGGHEQRGGVPGRRSVCVVEILLDRGGGGGMQRKGAGFPELALTNGDT